MNVLSTLNSNLSPAIASMNPWGSVMPSLAPDPAVPGDHFELSPSVQPEPSSCAAPGLSVSNLAGSGLASALGATPGLSLGIKLLLLGKESSAKEEFAQQLSSEHNVPHLHMGDFITAEIKSNSDLGKALAASKASGDNSPGDLINQLLEKKLSGQSEGFILDAYPSDLAKTDLKTLLGNKQQVKVVELTQGESSPCIPALQEADNEGQYYQVDDCGDKESTGTELNALMENFLTPNMGWLKK